MALLLDNELDTVVCGTFHPDLRTHRRCMVLAGFADDELDTYDDTGCGQPVVWTFTYRCLDCGRWFHRECIKQHFLKNAEPPY